MQVEGTGDGLRLRYEPGLDSEVNYLAFDHEVFLVEDGPRQVDDLQWWFLASQSDKSRNGWGAANYLQVIRCVVRCLKSCNRRRFVWKRGEGFWLLSEMMATPASILGMV